MALSNIKRPWYPASITAKRHLKKRNINPENLLVAFTIKEDSRVYCEQSAPTISEAHFGNLITCKFVDKTPPIDCHWHLLEQNLPSSTIEVNRSVFKHSYITHFKLQRPPAAGRVTTRQTLLQVEDAF